jgi:hypothetical protein
MEDAGMGLLGGGIGGYEQGAEGKDAHNPSQGQILDLMARKERHDRSEHKVYDAATEDDIEVYVCQIHAGKVREKNSVPQILCAQHADRTDRDA